MQLHKIWFVIIPTKLKLNAFKNILQRAYLAFNWIVWNFELGRRRDDLNASGCVLYMSS